MGEGVGEGVGVKGDETREAKRDSAGCGGRGWRDKKEKEEKEKKTKKKGERELRCVKLHHTRTRTTQKD